MPINREGGALQPEAEKPEVKLSPEQLLKKMEAAQQALEQAEKNRVRGLLIRRGEVFKQAGALNEKLFQTREILKKAEAGREGKKKVAPEYEEGLKNLEILVGEVEGGLRRLNEEVEDIEKDPAVMEELQEEAEGGQITIKADEDRIKREREKKETEERELKECKEQIDRTAGELIAFINTDKGWCIRLTNEGDSGYQQEATALYEQLAVLEKEYNTKTEQLREKESGILKFGVNKLREQMTNLKERKNVILEQSEGLTRKYEQVRKKYYEMTKNLGVAIAKYLIKSNSQWPGRKDEFPYANTNGFDSINGVGIRDLSKFFQTYGLNIADRLKK